MASVLVLPSARSAEIATSAPWVSIDPDASSASAGVVGFDPERHYLEGMPECVARYMLVIDSINFRAPTSPTSTPSRCSPTTSCRTCCGWTASWSPPSPQQRAEQAWPLVRPLKPDKQPMVA